MNLAKVTPVTTDRLSTVWPQSQSLGVSLLPLGLLSAGTKRLFRGGRPNSGPMGGTGEAGYRSALTQDGDQAACPFGSHDRPTPKGASPRLRVAPRLRSAEGRGAAASAAVGTR